MRATSLTIVLLTAASCLLPAQQAQAWRGGGFGGFHAGGFGAGGGFGGFSSFHAGGFGGGFGSVHYAGASHVGPMTGFTHVGGADAWGANGFAHYGGATHAGWGGAEHYGGWGGYHDGDAWGGFHATSVYHPANYGSIQHYDASAYHYSGAYGGWGHAVAGPAGYGAAVYHGPAGGTAAAYRGPYSSGAIAHLPSGYTAATWHGSTYYHSGYAFYQPTWYAGAVSYVPVCPPTGWFFSTLPTSAVIQIVNNQAYYCADGVYYQPSTQNGQQGYAVVATPQGAAPQNAVPQQTASTSNTPPDPLKILKKMSDYMASQQRIEMRINETFDQVALAGQKIQLSNQRTIQIRRPDRIALDVRGSSVHKRITFDGNTFTAVDLTRNVYTTMPMQGPLDAVMDQLSQKYGMAQPVEDLLYSDIYGRLMPKLQTGQYIGQEMMSGRLCHHLAFTQPGISWQIWIQGGDKPAPQKLVITYDTTPGRPRYSLWISTLEAPPSIPDSVFQAVLPDGAVSATLSALTGQTPAGQ